VEWTTLAIHIAAGAVAVLAGYAAILASKGGGVHRRAGMVFVCAMVVMGIAAVGVSFARDLPNNRLGGPVPMIMLLGTVILGAAIGDVRRLRAPLRTASARIVRHLWRMCWAFWIATGSFFIGQMDEFPAWLQSFALMAIPAFLPLVLMAYWLWRVRIRRVMARLTLVRVEP
jgi:uncharacterized membrane protein